MNRLTLFYKVLSNLMKVLQELEIKPSDELDSILSQEEDGFYYRLPKSQV